MAAMSCPRRLVAALVMAMLQCVLAENCCAKCLNNVPNFLYNPMEFTQCVAHNYCCFHCADKDIGSPTVLPMAGTVFNGTTTTATTGSFLQIRWELANLVTYVTFAPNQAKSGIPVLSSTQAVKRDGNVFAICPQYPGTLYFRGFGSDTCNSVSIEYPITVVSGVDGSSCTGVSPTPLSPSTTTSGPGTLSSAVVVCNLARGSVIDGVCVCASDWIGPPECVGTPIWKWLVTIGGGVAALCSISVSIRAFVISRKAKKKQCEAASGVGDATSPKKAAAVVVEMETMRMETPDRRESCQPPDIPYVESESIDHASSSTPPPTSKEYTI